MNIRGLAVLLAWGVLMGVVSLIISRTLGFGAQLIFLPVSMVLSLPFGMWLARQEWAE